MGAFTELLNQTRSAGYGDKKQFLDYLVHLLSQIGPKLDTEDGQEVLAFADAELRSTVWDLQQEKDPHVRCDCFDCADRVLAARALAMNGEKDLSDGAFADIRRLMELRREMFPVETAIAAAFGKEKVGAEEARAITGLAEGEKDEFLKGRFFTALMGQEKENEKLTGEAKKIFGAYIRSEMERFAATETPSQDQEEAMELAVDLCRWFADGEMRAAVSGVTEKGIGHINFYALDTALDLGWEPEQKVIDGLAADLEFADLTHRSLVKHGKEDLFPEDKRDEVYLAKSDLCHWLTFPTELGKLPDDIVYLGKVKKLFSSEVFHVFRFLSSSDTLAAEERGKWMVGWSSNEGGTFSSFDLYEKFEAGSPEKTLKNIKKMILG